VATIKNIDKVSRFIQEKMAKATRDKNASVSVGFQTSYAIYVHENLEANHPVGQAKFLEQPAREYQAEIVRIIRQAWLKGATMLQCLMLGGLRLQREAQKLVPVDTGNLKRSASTLPD